MNKNFLFILASILLVSCGSGTEENSNTSMDSTTVKVDSMCTDSTLIDTTSVDSLNH